MTFCEKIEQLTTGTQIMSGGFFEIASQGGWNLISILHVFVNRDGKKRDHKAFRVLKKGNAINIVLSYGGTALWFSLFCYNITSLTHTDFPA